MRNLRKIPLTDVEKTFPVLGEEEKRTIWGGSNGNVYGNLPDDPPPSYPGFSVQYFSSFQEAYEASKNYSNQNNGKALFVIASTATDWKMRMPIFKDVYGADATFHFHPGDGPNEMSQADSIAMELFIKHNIDSLIILTNDTIKGYKFDKDYKYNK